MHSETKSETRKEKGERKTQRMTLKASAYSQKERKEKHKRRDGTGPLETYKNSHPSGALALPGARSYSTCALGLERNYYNSEREL